MNELKPLLIRPPLLPQETLASYLHRIAAANGHTSSIVSQLAAENLFWPDQVSHPNHAETMDVIAALTRLPHHKIYFAGGHGLCSKLVPREKPLERLQFLQWYDLPKIPRRLVFRYLQPKSKPKYCPFCLAEAAYQRQPWLLRSVAACIHHQSLLLDKCPSCGKGIKVADLVQAQCSRCQFELSRAESLDLAEDEAGLFAQGLLYFWISAGPYLKASTPHAATRELHGVLHVLKHLVFSVKEEMEGLHHYPSLSRPLIWQSLHQRTIEQEYVAVATAMQGLLNWPDGFYDFLDRVARRDDRYNPISIQANFKYLFSSKAVDAWQKNESFQFVYKAFITYVQSRYARPILQKYKFFQTNPLSTDGFKWMLVQEAAEHLNVTERTIKHLLRQGLITVREDTANTRYKLLRAKDIFALKHRWFNAVPLADAALWLGVSKDVVLGLVELNLVHAVRGPVVDKSPNWKISRQSLERLLEYVRSATRSHLTSGLHLTEAAQMLSPYRISAAKIIKLVLKGQFRGRCRETDALDKLLLSKRDLKNYLNALKNVSPMVSRGQVAKQMRVKPEVIDLWATQKLLTPVQGSKQGTFFHREDVDAFVSSYINSKQASKLLSVGMLIVQKWTRNGRLPAASGPGADSRGVYLYRREDVEKLAPKNRYTAPQLANKLGISPAQLNVWIKQGKVKPFTGPGIDGCGRYLFRKDEIEPLILERG
ncbi:MAG: TniQ family protein [Anaerolineales bacterium]|nr:TniQ family protein [Anaerolineales bacterium]